MTWKLNPLTGDLYDDSSGVVAESDPVFVAWLATNPLSGYSLTSHLHTGVYEPTISILAASKGGTGVANGASATLTLPNFPITIAGGVTGGTYTLPATVGGDTIATLGATNEFTAAQTINVGTGTGLEVKGSVGGVGTSLWVTNVASGIGCGIYFRARVGTSGSRGFFFDTVDASGVYVSRNASFGVAGLAGDFPVAGYFVINTASSLYNNNNLVIAPTTGFIGMAKLTGIPATRLHIKDDTTTTNAIREVQRIEAVVSTASTGGAAGFGVGQTFYAETATDGTSKQQGQVATYWRVATNNSQTGVLRFSAWDYGAERVGMEIEGSGTATMLSFYGGTNVVRGAALTAQLTTITYTAPGTPDYALQDVTQITPWGFADAEEARTFISVVKNLQDRCAQLEARLGSATGVNLFA